MWFKNSTHSNSPPPISPAEIPPREGNPSRAAVRSKNTPQAPPNSRRSRLLHQWVARMEARFIARTVRSLQRVSLINSTSHLQTKNALSPKGSGRTRSCPRYHLIFPQRGRSQPGNGGTAAPYWCSGAELGSHLPPSGGETCTVRLLSLPPAVGYSSSATLLQDLIIWDFQRVVKGFGRKAACQALTRPSAHPPTGSPPRRPRGAPGHRTSGPHP